MNDWDKTDFQVFQEQARKQMDQELKQSRLSAIDECIEVVKKNSPDQGIIYGEAFLSGYMEAKIRIREALEALKKG